MESQLEKDFNKYLKELNRELICSRKTKKIFIDNFKSRVNEYTEENKNCTIEDIIKNFGTQKEIANGFVGKSLDVLEQNRISRILTFVSSLLVLHLIIILVLHTISQL